MKSTDMKVEKVAEESNRKTQRSLVAMEVVDSWSLKMMSAMEVEVKVVVEMELNHMGFHKLSTLCIRSDPFLLLLSVEIVFWVGNIEDP